MKKLLCIDGNSILNRQFYGIRYLSNKEGFPTNAIYGMINVIGKQLDDLSPDFCAIAFDLKAPSTHWLSTVRMQSWVSSMIPTIPLCWL